MQPATLENSEQQAHSEKQDSPATQFPAEARFPPLHLVTRPAVNTAAAAFYLNRAEQTLRLWACFQRGPLRPLNIGGRLA